MRDAALVAVSIGLRESEQFSLSPSRIDLPQRNACIFNRACKAVGSEDFHWHDLRHTWASWHVQRGTPLLVLKELGGWETIEMVQKYAHLAPSHIAAHANTVKFWSISDGQEKTPLVRAA